MWALLGGMAAVEGVWVGARGVLVEQRAGDFILVPAVVLQRRLAFTVHSQGGGVSRGTYAGVRLAVGLVVVGHGGQRVGAALWAMAYNRAVGRVSMQGDGIQKEWRTCGERWVIKGASMSEAHSSGSSARRPR